jgi:hypothetical protein
MMMTLRVVLCIPALDVKYAEKNTGMSAALNAVLVLGKIMQMIAKKDSDWIIMTNSFENIGQDVEIEPVDSLKCYLVIAGKRITEFNGETCYMDAQRMGFDVLMKRIYGNN